MAEIRLVMEHQAMVEEIRSTCCRHPVVPHWGGSRGAVVDPDGPCLEPAHVLGTLRSGKHWWAWTMWSPHLKLEKYLDGGWHPAQPTISEQQGDSLLWDRVLPCLDPSLGSGLQVLVAGQWAYVTDGGFPGR